MQYEEEGGEGEEYEYFEAPEDARKAYVKKMIKESKDLPGQFKRPDYKAGLSSPSEPESVQISEKMKEEGEETPKPVEKKKEEYEL